MTFTIVCLQFAMQWIGPSNRIGCTAARIVTAETSEFEFESDSELTVDNSSQCQCVSRSK